MLDGLKRIFGLPESQTYSLSCNEEIELPEHDENNSDCSCPSCIEAFLQRTSDDIMSGN